MSDQNKTKSELIDELTKLRQRALDLESLEAENTRAKEALRESEEKLKSNISSMNDLVFLLDKNGVFIEYYQPSGKSDLHASPDLFLGRHFKDVLPIHVVDKLENVIKDVKNTEGVRQFDYPLIIRDGELWYNAVVSIRKDILDKYSGITIVVRDITDQKRAEEELRKAKGELEARVEERTSEIREANKKLQLEVTELKKTEEVLNETEEMYRLVTDMMESSVWLMDMNFVAIFANPSATHLRGYTLEELKKMPIEQNLTPESLKTAMKRISEEMTPERLAQKDLDISATLDLEFYRKGGSTQWYEVTISLIRDKDGNPCKILGVSRDISKRRKAEEALWKSQQEYKSLFEDSPISLWVEDFSEVKKYIDTLRKSGVEDFREYFKNNRKDVEKCASLVRVVDINRVTLEMYKAESKDDFFGGLGLIFDEGSYDAFEEEIIKIAEGKTSYEGETVNRTLTGEKKHISFKWTVAPGSEETYSKILVSILDITDRKQAEEALQEREVQLSNILSSSAVGIGYSDERKIKWANEAMTKMFGYEDEKDYIGKDTRILYATDEEYERIGKIVYNGLKVGKVAETDAKFVRKDGSIFDGHIKISAPDPSKPMSGTFTNIIDITRRKQVEKALKESEAKFRSIVESSKDVIYVSTVDGRLIEINHSGKELFGYTDDELFKLYTKELYADKNGREIFIEEIDKMGFVKDYELRMRKKDGSIIECIESAVQIKDKDSKVIGYQGIIRDITEKKQVEKALLKSEESLDIALIGADLGTWDFDFESGIITRNRRESEIWENPPDHIIDNLKWLETKIHPDDKEVWISAFQKHAEGSIPQYEAEIRIRSETGKYKWIRSRGKITKVDKDGNPVRVSGTNLDITEQKEAEKKLRESEKKFTDLLENTRDYIYIIKISGEIEFANKAARDLLGYDNNELMGINSENFIAPQSRDYLKEILKRQMAKDDVGSFEVDFAIKNGEIRTFEVKENLIWDGDRIVEKQGIARDVTERKHSEEQLRHIAQGQEAILNSLSEIVIYHDIEMRIIWANSKACKLAESQLEDMVGNICYELWFDRTSPCKGCPMVQALKDGSEHKGKIVYRDDEECLLKAYPVIDQRGATIGVYLVGKPFDTEKVIDDIPSKISIIQDNIMAHQENTNIFYAPLDPNYIYPFSIDVDYKDDKFVLYLKWDEINQKTSLDRLIKSEIATARLIYLAAKMKSDGIGWVRKEVIKTGAMDKNLNRLRTLLEESGIQFIDKFSARMMIRSSKKEKGKVRLAISSENIDISENIKNFKSEGYEDLKRVKKKIRKLKKEINEKKRKSHANEELKIQKKNLQNITTNIETIEFLIEESISLLGFE